jgi:small conductance mechanosensitive channel
MQDSLSKVEGKLLDKSSLAPYRWSFDWDEFWEGLISHGMNTLIAVAVLTIGFLVVRRMLKALTRILKKKDLDPSLQLFLLTLTSVSLKILVILTALAQLGIEMTSFVALIGAAGLAIGMAFSGTLGNFAGGIMILVFRPFKLGDYISAHEVEGKVDQIHIFNTYLITQDNKTVIVPNGILANGNMTNFTQLPKRRVDFNVALNFGADYDAAKLILQRFIEEEEKVLKNEPNFIGLSEIEENSIKITMRVWCATEDYWEVYFHINEKIYKEFSQDAVQNELKNEINAAENLN